MQGEQADRTQSIFHQRSQSSLWLGRQGRFDSTWYLFSPRRCSMSTAGDVFECRKLPELATYGPHQHNQSIWAMRPCVSGKTCEAIPFPAFCMHERFRS